MASKHNLLEVSYHSDTDTGIHRVGEIDFGICGTLEEFLIRYGAKGKDEILSTLSFLAWAVQDRYNKIYKDRAPDQKSAK